MPHAGWLGGYAKTNDLDTIIILLPQLKLAKLQSDNFGKWHKIAIYHFLYCEKWQGLIGTSISFIVVLVIMIVVSLLIWIATMILSSPIVMSGISQSVIERRQYEIDIIWKKTNKKELISILPREDKKVLLKELIFGSLVGTIAPVVATIIGG